MTVLWTPIERGLARVDRTSSEDPGTLDHFRDGLILGELLMKCHVGVLLALANYVEEGSVRHVEYRLSRSGGLGDWSRSASELVIRREFAIGLGSDDPLHEYGRRALRWLSLGKRREDDEAIRAIFEPVHNLRCDLLGSDRSGGRATPLEIFRALVEIRNKTHAHGIHGTGFWAQHAETIEEAVRWIAAASPMAAADLVTPVRSARRSTYRILAGSEPSQSMPAKDASPSDGSCLLHSGGRFAPLPTLFFLDASSNDTYIANGQWREGDASAEFVCHAIEASLAADGRRRIILEEYAIAPLPTISETSGLDEMIDSGSALHSLPPRPRAYVHRPTLESDLLRHLGDPQVRHVVNLRGGGGFGKTSLVLHTCHELTQLEHCPYDFVVWFSARDVDLTLSGPVQVERTTGSLNDVWLRFARLLGEPRANVDEARELFESSVRDGQTSFLLIVDNFETFDDQASAYEYLDRTVRPPSKVVITSRHDFRGDSQVRVAGMDLPEARQLLLAAARAAGREGQLGDIEISRIWERCQGHPYAMKLIAASVVAGSGLNNVLNGVLGRAELLEALCRQSIASVSDDDDAQFVFLLVARFDAGIPSVVLAAACAEQELDWARGVEVLVERSLVDADQPGRITMPTMAREFGRERLIHGHLLEAVVRESEKFILRWNGLVAGHLVLAANAMLRAVEETPEDRRLVDRVTSYQESLADGSHRVWPVLARTLRVAGYPEAKWSDAYKRAIEANPGDVDTILEWSDLASGALRRVGLKVQAVQADPARIDLASSVGSFLNELYQRNRAVFTRVQWTSLMRPVIDALVAHETELDGDGASRLAWLLIHADRDQARAAQVVEAAVARNPENDHLTRLRATLLERRAAAPRR